MEVLVGLAVDAAENSQRIDIRVERIEKLTAQTRLLGLIEMIAFNQVVFRQIKNLQLHETASLICCFAVSHSMKVAFPS